MGDCENILYLKDCKNIAKPIYVDFNEYNNKSVELIKACGLSNKNKINILDCTAGLCKDTFILANNNCNVVAIEKNKIVYSLLEDGFKRGFKLENIANILGKIQLFNDDSVNYLNATKLKFDCIYLDPMFDESKKTRLVKKEMQFFHNLIDKINDNELLFDLSIKKTCGRVVVKRPLHSDFIVNRIMPSFQVKGKTIRYDVYLR